MDPNATRAELLRIARSFLAPDSDSIDTGDAVRLAELVDELDRWIRRGGFLPERWVHPKPIDHRPKVDRSGCHQRVCTCHDDGSWIPGRTYPNGCDCGCHWAE